MEMNSYGSICKLCILTFCLLLHQNCAAKSFHSQTTTTRTTTQNINNHKQVLFPLTTTKPSYGDSSEIRQSRQMQAMPDYDQQMDEDEDNVESKAIKNDPWAGYYDFLITEGSFKFWAAFQLATAILLIYSAFAAVYYAKFNPISSDYDYYDEFLFRSNGRSNDKQWSWLEMLDKHTFQRILDAIASKKYS